MNKNDFAPLPPMGWNSYDYYNTTANEAEIRANAAYMAENLRSSGWEYVVVDIEWYAWDAGSQPEFQYIPFGKVEMDEYSRLLPCPDRFPSSAEGAGFRPLSDYIHSLGLKFGIHIMRGIPRAAAAAHGKILGTDVTADRVADPSNICFWNPDMYGVRTNHPAAQIYYNSLFQLYADWGVDFVKCDDICREDMPSAHDEIRMLHEAVMNCGRPIVLSLSPGPAKLTEARHYRKYANMWRITDDFWDTWPLLKEMFRRCEMWQAERDYGCYPDCDMLPVGVIGGRFGKGEERRSLLTYEEQRLMMTLWCMFGSPLMIGGELTMMSGEDLALLTNQDVLDMLRFSGCSKQIRRTAEEAVWVSGSREKGCSYLAFFNLDNEERALHIWAGEAAAGGFGSFPGRTLRELWTGEEITPGGSLAVTVPPHGVRVFRYEGG